MVRMWEAGSHRPRDYYELFILAYATVDELGASAAAPGSDLDHLMAALDLMGIPMDRRRFLLNSAALAVGIAAQQRRSILDLFDDDPVLHATGRLEFLQRLRGLGEPAERVYRLLVQHAKDLDVAVGKVAGTEIELDLLAVQARTLSTAGHVSFFDLGDHVKAEEHLRAGMQPAARSSDPRLRALLCYNLSHRRIFDQSQDRQTNLYDALWIVGIAIPYADGDPFILTDLYDTRAALYAGLGREGEMREALDQAEIEIEAAKGDPPKWFSGVNVNRVRETAGISYLQLGDTKRAADMFGRALATADASRSQTVRETYILAYAAQAFALTGEPEQSVSLLREAIPTASRSQSMSRIKRISEARATLAPWDSEPFVRGLDEQLASAGLTA